MILTKGLLLNERYRIDSPLGEGAYGQVYLAHDIKLQRACVVKSMVVPEGLPPEEVQELQECFRQEAHLLASLNHPGHPSIPEIFDFFLDSNGNYLVMKYIEGESVQQRFEHAGGQLPWQEAIGYILQVCEALDYLHSHRPEPVIHRDVKPTNILIDSNGRAWLADYGTAQISTRSSQAGLTPLGGTPGYTPLEQWMMKPQPASDVYALGATLHYLITGRDPAKPFYNGFDLELLENHNGRFPPVSEFNPSVPPALDEVVAEALLPNPDHRPTARQWSENLVRMLPRHTAVEPFTFVDGTQAHSVEDLAALCETHWDEAIQYLYDGTFEFWLRSSIFRTDLSAAAQMLLTTEKKAHYGVERFIRTLNPGLPAPRVEVQPPVADFGSISPGQPSVLELTISNTTRGYVPFEVESADPYLKVSPAKGGLHAGHPVQVTAILTPKLLQSGTIDSEIVLRTPGDEQAIPVSARLHLWRIIWDRLGPPLSAPFRWLTTMLYAFGVGAAFTIALLFGLNRWYESGAIYALYLLYVAYPLVPLSLALGAVVGAAIGGWVFSRRRLFRAWCYGLLLAWGGLGLSLFAWLLVTTPLVDPHFRTFFPVAALVLPAALVALAVAPFILVGTRPVSYTTVIFAPLLIVALVVALIFLAQAMQRYGITLPIVFPGG